MRKNLVLLGMMGVGKSTLGKIVANQCNLKFIDIDLIIEEKNLMSVSQIFKKKGESFFRFEEEKIALNSLNKSGSIIALGGGAFINEKIRKKVLNLAVSIWLDVDINLLNNRLKKNTKRPMLKNGNIQKTIKELYQRRKDTYNLANYKIDCSRLSVKKITQKIIDIYKNE